MKKIIPKTDNIIMTANRDAMHLQLMSKVRLNRYDMKFMANISEKYLLRGLPLSPGQNDLYEKIVHKYRKQLKKLKADYRLILALPWENGIVDAETLNQQTFFRITDAGIMEMYFNFNKAHIEEIRALIHDDASQHLNRGIDDGGFGNGQKYNFNFTNTTKTWHGPFNVYLFKKLYEFAVSHHIKIEDSITEVVNKLNSTGTKEEWTPSLHIVNDRMYVSHITEAMLPTLDALDAQDISLANIERYAKLGLQPPANHKALMKYIDGGSGQTKAEIHTVEDVAELKDYIKTMGRSPVFYINELGSPRFTKSMPDVLEAFADCETWGPDGLIVTSENERGLRGYGAAPIPVYNNTARDVPLDTPEEVDNLVNKGYNTLITTTPLTSIIRSQSKTGKFALEADKVIHLSLIEPK